MIKLFPSFSFLFSIFKTLPTPSSDIGRASIADWTQVHTHDLGDNFFPKYFEIHTLSKAALKAVFIIFSSTKASKTSLGNFSPLVKSTIFTFSSSKA